MAAVYSELRIVAEGRLSKLAPGHSLSATALVHEMWMRLDRSPKEEWKSRAEFFGAAGTLMRNILVDRAREKSALRRGGDRRRVQLTTGAMSSSPDRDLEAVHEALESLEREDPRSAQLVVLRFFAGMTIEEVAEALEISPRTARRDWSFARAWLYQNLAADESAPEK